jgi:NTE family protein
MGDMSSARTVLVLQGGGALGAYQAGVLEALAQAGTQPTWFAGISIGAINAAIIAGAPPERRIERLHEFWDKVSSGVTDAPGYGGVWGRTVFNAFSAGWTAAIGAPGLFAPRIPPSLAYPPGAPQALSLYDTSPLRSTLETLVDFDLINRRRTRLSVGAVNVRTGNFAYFDNTKQKIGPEHVMASAALPPGFPPIEIDGELYWDGGLVSNTPLQYVLDEGVKEDLLIFQVDLFPSRGPLPLNLADVAEREKDIRYSSRTRLETDAQLGLHEIKVLARRLVGKLPDKLKSDPDAVRLGELARENAVCVVQLIYRDKPYEGGVKDYDFSRPMMLEHWESGVTDARRTLRHSAEFTGRPPEGGVWTYDIGRPVKEQQPKLRSSK